MVPLSLLPAAQDWPPDQHLLQRRKAALVDGQCGGGSRRRRVPPRHVWHRGLVAHLGTEKEKENLSASSHTDFVHFYTLFCLANSLSPDAVLSV